MAKKMEDCGQLEGIGVLRKQQCKRSLAALNCYEDPDKTMVCFAESAKPENEENCLLGNIDKRRRKFVTKNKEDITQLGRESFSKLIAFTLPPPPPPPEPEEPKGAIYEFEEFKTPFSETNSDVSSVSSKSDAGPSNCK